MLLFSKPILRIIIAIFLGGCIEIALNAQPLPTRKELTEKATSTTANKKSDNDNYHFLNLKENRFFGNNELIHKLYEQFYDLQMNSKKVNQISIVHIGDSHLQAGFLSGTVMQNLHKDFGNAGRGLIFPLQLIGTNEPTDYNIFSSSKWKSSRCILQRVPFTIGIGGLSMYPLTDKYDLEFSTNTKSSTQYPYNTLKIFHNPNSKEFSLSAENATVISVKKKNPYMTEFKFNKELFNAKLSGTLKTERDSFIFYGASLENDKNGVLYHAIGLNGAQFVHYARIPHMAEQIASLQPQLIIFSLGTNEAFRGSFHEGTFLRDVSRVIQPIREKNSDAIILITTPAECQIQEKINGKKEHIPNPLIAPIRSALIKFSKTNNLIYWDMYTVAGGAGASEEWIEAKLLARDRVHFQIPGYKLQGNLFYQAFLNGYKQYASTRPN